MIAERATLSLVVGILVAAGLLPLLAVVVGSLTVDGRFSLAYYEALLTSCQQWHLLGNSLLLASLVAAAATLVGLPLGILFAKSDLPLRGALAVLFAIPLLLPPYILAVAWFHVLGRGGLVALWFGPAMAERTHAWLFGLPSCVLVLTSSLMPIVLLLTVAFVRTVHPRLEEAARIAAPWRSVLVGITIPLILPGVLLGALLVFLLALGEFGIPMFLRYDVHAVESFTQFAAFYQPDAATAAAVPLGLVTLLVLVLERLLLRDWTYEVRFASSGADAVILTVGRLRRVLFGAVAMLCALTVLLPLGSLAVSSAVAGTYAEALSRSWDALLRSLGYAAAGASLLTLVGFFVGYLVQRRSLAGWRSVDSLTVLLFALPSTVVGIGLVTLWNRPGAGALYGTPLLVLVGYLAQYTALTSRTTVAGLSAIPRSMEEAARMTGAGWFRRTGQIVAPLAARALGAAWLIGYL
ncbi:MAG TPA: ABC transporter permease subunit, partial [Longimicrobiaceae bacterium]|nr:ABC transporter permease subunit [Longimicrobiaceae bacterium]